MAKVQIIGGPFQDVEGNVLANGYLTMQLSGDAQISTVGQACSGMVVRVPLDATGAVQTSPQFLIWSNDQLVPSGTFYIINAYTASGQLVWGPQYQQVLSSPSPFNINAWVPSGSSVFSSGTGLTLQTNSLNNGSQAKLNLVAGSNMTLTDDGSGDITLTAGGGGGFSTSGVGGFWSAGLPMMIVPYGAQTTSGTVSTTIDQVTVFQFTLGNPWTISRVSCRVSSGAIGGSFSFGIYSTTGNKLLDSGALPATTSNTNQSNSITPVILPLGTYYFACSSHATGSSATAVFLNSLGIEGILNANGTVKVGQAANSTVSGVMPTTLGTITADSLFLNMPAVFFGV